MWRELLRAAVARSNKQAVAQALGCSRTLVSLVANGKYHASTDGLAAKVLETYGRHVCPHMNREVSMEECRRASGLSSPPTSSPMALRLWRACQACPHKPQGVAS